MEASLPRPKSQNINTDAGSRRSWELLAILAFFVVNLLAPIICGEMFPFTVSPMFSDQPSEYATYEIKDARGKSLDAEDFGLHLVYDGNPPGLGMGIVPTPTLHKFGDVPNRETVTRHIREVMSKKNIAGPIAVKRTLVLGGGRQLEETTNVWLIEGAVSQ